MLNESKQTPAMASDIVNLYKNGMSQKDISRTCGVCRKITRNVLQSAGFNTAQYRRFPFAFEEIIYVLLRAGVTYRSVAEVTDISFHVIRDIAERRPDRDVRSVYKKPKVAASDRENQFIARFLSGECFCVICENMRLSNKEILRCYSLLEPELLKRHSEALCERLNAEDMNYNNPQSLARKYGISASTVKAHLNK